MPENCKATLISFICLIAIIPSAEAKNYPIKLGLYQSSSGSVATILRADEQLILSVASRPARGRGSSAGADCELRARYNPNNDKWELIPFHNETINIRFNDISRVIFYFNTKGNTIFNINTDFQLTNCAIGVSFDRTFRFLRKI